MGSAEPGATIESSSCGCESSCSITPIASNTAEPSDWTGEMCAQCPGPGTINESLFISTGVIALARAAEAREQHYSVELAEAVINESRLELICDDRQVDELVELSSAPHEPAKPRQGGFTSATSFRQFRLRDGHDSVAI